MDLYKIQEKLPDSTLGHVYRVTENGDESVKTLKEIECLDLRSAESVLDQFALFHRIKHRCLRRIEHSFIKWDTSISSFFVCVVSQDDMIRSDLGSYLKEMRASRASVPLKTIKKYLAHIIEGVHFMHTILKRVHRNLNPSSIYLVANMDESGDEAAASLTIGDYGVAGVMDDVKVRTRVLPGCFDYTAPEIAKTKTYDDKSDIWSIGSVLLDMCTTSVYSSVEFKSMLANIKHGDPQILTSMLSDVFSIYEYKSLASVIGAMLNTNRNDRVTLKELVHNFFVQECLDEINSELVMKSSRITDVPKLTEELIASIKKSSGSAAKLDQMINDARFNEVVHSLLVELMSDQAEDINLQLSALRILEQGLMSRLKTLSADHNAYEIINLTVPNWQYVLKTFFYVFLKYEHSREVQLFCVKILILLVNFENAAKHLISYDLISFLLNVLRNFSTDAVICGYTCKAIWLFCGHAGFVKSLENKKCCAHIKEVLLSHVSNDFCLEQACNVLVGLTSSERLIGDEESDVDMTRALLALLKGSLKSPVVVRSSCMALSGLINFSEECAYRFLYCPIDETNPIELDGFEIILMAYKKHKDRADVVERICHLLKDLSNYDEMLIEMKSLNLHDLLIRDIQLKYADHASISEMCAQIESNMLNHST